VQRKGCSSTVYIVVGVLRESGNGRRVKRTGYEELERMSADGVFVFVRTYPDAEGAEGNYEVVKGLHSAGIVGTYDAAVVDENLQGKVRVHKHEKPTQHGAWSGLAVGALLGILFPPGIIAGGIVGAAAGA
jgi:uncharacterized membrane protein